MVLVGVILNAMLVSSSTLKTVIFPDKSKVEGHHMPTPACSLELMKESGRVRSALEY